MIDSAKTKVMGIAVSGEMTQSERILILAGCAVVLLLAAILVRKLVLRRRRMKNAIFCNSKNKYKSRLGKKVKY